MQAFNVKLNNKFIDRVFFQDSFTAEEVKQSLVGHDGYDANIVVTKARRKLKDEFIMQANYGYGHGWEDECSEETRAAINQRLKEYRENAGTVGQYRVIVRRVPV